MAQHHRSPRSTTYGSLAYDLDAIARERLLEEAAELPAQPQAQPQPQRRPRAQARAKTRPSPLLIGSIITLAVMVMVLLLGYTQLTATSNAVSAIRSDIADLEGEHVKLLTDYERTFDLATIKQKAEEMGMSKPNAGQIEYIDLSGEDKAVIYSANNDGVLQGVRTTVSAAADSVWEYFR